MHAAKNNIHEEQSIGKTFCTFFTSILAGKSTPSPTTRRQGETNQTKRHGNKHRRHHHHHHHPRHGPHEFDPEETQGFEYPLNCEISADAGFWEKAHHLQSEAILRRPPKVTIKSSNRLLADLSGGIDALSPRKTPATSGSHRRRRHREHHSSAQSEDPISKPPQAAARLGEDGVVEKRNKNKVKDPFPAAQNPASGFGSHRRRRHYDHRYPEVVPNIPPIIKLKAGISNKAEEDSVQDIHHTLRNRQVTGHSQARAIPSQSKCNQTQNLPVESRRDKSSVNLENITAREEALQISNPNNPTMKESYVQEIPSRQNVLRHQGVQIMHPPRPKGWPHSQEATIVNAGISDRDSVLTRVSDFMPKPLKIRPTRTPAKHIPDLSSYSEPSTPAVTPSPRPNATWLPGVVDDDANRESRSSSSRAPNLNQAIHMSPQFHGSSPARQNRGSAPASYLEDSLPTQAASNEEWLSSSDYAQELQHFCRICHKPCVQDRRFREVEHIICPTCEARAFVKPYPSIAKIVDHPASRVGSPASFDRSRRPSGGSTSGGRIRGRDTPTSPTLHEGEELQLPPPVPLKTGSQSPYPKDVGPSNFPRGRQVIPLTPPSSTGSSHSRFKDGGCSPQYRTPRVIPPASPSPSPPISQIPRQIDNPNFPRGGRVRPPIPLAPLDQSNPTSMLFPTGSPTRNTKTTSSSIGQNINRLQPHDNNHLASSSRKNPSSRPSVADSYVTCTHNDDEILRFIPFILDDDAPGLGIYLGSGDEKQQQQQQQQAAAQSPRTPSSPMENREKNFVGRYQNKWGLPYSPSVSTANEDRNEGVDRPTWYYDHYDRLLSDHHQEGDPGGGGGADDRRRRRRKSSK